MKMLMSALEDENEIQIHLDHEQQKRRIDETFVNNEKRRESQIANGEDFDEEEYTAANQELLQKRSEHNKKVDFLMKSGDAGAI